MICVAAIGGARGVHGDVRLRTFTDAPETVARFGTLYSSDGQKTYALQDPKVLNGDVISRIDGIATREEAMAMKGTELFVPRESFPETDDEEEFYVSDLIGLTVLDETGKKIGSVRNVDNFGANDVLEVTLDGDRHSEKESASGAALKGSSLLLPFTRAMVPEIDIAGGRITVIVPDQLLPEGGEPDDPDDGK